MNISKAEKVSDRRSDDGANKRRAIYDERRLQQIARRKFDAHFVARFDSQIFADKRRDPSISLARTEQTRATAAPFCATRTLHYRFNLDQRAGR